MANPLVDGLYGLLFKRSTIYIPFIFVGAYYTNAALDYSIATAWKSRNRGKLFEDVIAAQHAE